MKASGNTIFVTGASAGIGRALAIALYRAGNTVIAGGRNGAALDALVAEHPGMSAMVLDVADPREVSAGAARLASWRRLNGFFGVVCETILLL